MAEKGFFRTLLSKAEEGLTGAYARIVWAQMVRRAERIWRSSPRGGRVAVIRHPARPKKLLYINRAGFRGFKRRFPVRRGTTFGSLLAGAWYYTGGASGENRLSGADYEARRRAFVMSMSRSLGR